jgi:hypothetical protein
VDDRGHPHCNAARNKKAEVSGAIDGFGNLSRENLAQIQALTTRLESLRDAAILAV